MAMVEAQNRLKAGTEPGFKNPDNGDGH